MDTFWDFFWVIVSVFLFTAYLVVMFQIVLDVFRDRSTSGLAKACWVLFLIVLPVITALVYLVVRGEAMGSRSESGHLRATSPAEEIERAKGLLDSGAIHQEEYKQIKARALA